eukprot:scaffold108813_cov62-Attheya_sp.AAC.3
MRPLKISETSLHNEGQEETLKKEPKHNITVLAEASVGVTSADHQCRNTTQMILILSWPRVCRTSRIRQ